MSGHYPCSVGWRDRFRFVLRAAQQAPAAPAEPSRVLFSWPSGPFLPGGTYVGTTYTSRVTRDEALSVPAVLRGRNLLASIATLQLKQHGPDRSVSRSPLLEQIDPTVPNVVTLGMTVEDLLFDSVSWWRITAFGWDGFPVEAKHLDVDAVGTSPPPGYPLHTLPSGMFPNGAVWIMGHPVDAGEIIRFDSPNPPLLTAGARAIRRALKLAQAAEMYADDPEARAYWRPAEGADPADDTQIADMLDAYAEARRTRAEAYIPAAVIRETIDVMSAADRQLVELQRRSDLEIANLLGLDPEDLGINTTSRTYQNATDRRQDRINDVLSPYMRAITDRLSMNDVTKRGYRVSFDLDDYLRADPKTRAEVAKILHDIEALTVDEIREEEDLPALTPAQRRELKPPAPPAQPQMPAQQPHAPAGAPMAAARQSTPAAATFTRESGIQFDLDEVQVHFAVDEGRREITGIVVPFGPVARSGGRKWRFSAGSLKFSDISRVKLLIDHDNSQAIGKATKTWATPEGQWATFKVARTPAGDRALALAADGVMDGFSVGVDFNENGYAPDPADRSVNDVVSAAWRETSLTAMPSFDDARVTGVAATAQERDLQMTATTEQTAPAAPAAAPDTTAAFTAAVEAFTAAVERLGAMPTEQRATIPATSSAKVTEPLVYSLTGMGPSFVRDAWEAHKGRYGSKETDEALARLRKYEEQTVELANQAALRFANAGNTTDQAQIIPPGYRPDMYVGMIPQGRPLNDAWSHGTIANSTPFKVPVWVGSSGLNGTNSEGTGPSTGTITNHTYRTVTPTAQSGEFVVTRELMDSSNPAIDQIAQAAMREEYAQDTEAIIAAALAAATDNNTGAGQSTEGCYVYSCIGTGSDLADTIDGAWASFPYTRFLPPNRLLFAQTAYTNMVQAKDLQGRRLFPYNGPSNAQGGIGGAAQSIDVNGMPGRPAWSLTAGTDDAVTFNSVDGWVWESPLLSFRFEEKSGPENIVLNIWGYHAFQILRYTGIHAVAYTAA